MKNGRTILVVDDEPGMRQLLKRSLDRKFDKVLEASTVQKAMEHLGSGVAIDVVLTDVALPDGEGFEIVDQASEMPTNPAVLVMTGLQSIDNPINALRHNAADFLLKPFSLDALDQAIHRALERRTTITESGSFRAIADPTEARSWRRENCPDIVGEHPSLLRVFSIIERVADTDCSVLVTGESGTGKELVARGLHRASDRKSGPFVTVNCAAIPENLLESELFGHVKGAFTGATSSRKGRFLDADGGTLFLDEIGELPLNLQGKLLRALQEKVVCAVGESKERRVDVRIIAATNRDLEEMVEARSFREDLLYRLNVIPLELPPLRERSSDIQLLVQHFVAEANAGRRRSVEGVDDEAMTALSTYGWPGNIRQLRNVIERVVVLKGEGVIEFADLPPRIRKARGASSAGILLPTLPEEGIALRDAVERFENALIVQALERTGWNKNRAASILKMNRTTLVEKLKKKDIKKAG
ncbi:MAG: sigma-54 dependent transcriptional regulator [Myxococcota bacterium]